jgi:hypothetical protein
MKYGSDLHTGIVFTDPNTFLLDHLLQLKPVKFLEGELIHDLLNIFVSEKLEAYLRFYESHKEFISDLGLKHEDNIRKMKLLTFMQMAENRSEITFQVPYPTFLLLLSFVHCEDFLAPVIPGTQYSKINIFEYGTVPDSKIKIFLNTVRYRYRYFVVSLLKLTTGIH